jgi:AraC-like DNA-binding protein
VTPRYDVAGYREFVPPGDMAAYCEALWIHRTPAATAPGGAHRVLPEVAVGVGFEVIRDDEGRPAAGVPILIGPTLHAQTYDLLPGRELAAIRIKAEWAGPLLGIDPPAFEDQVVDLFTVCPRIADRLHDALWHTRTPEESVRVLAAAIRGRFDAASAPPSAIASAALERVRRTAGRVTCDRLAAGLGVSDRHFRRHVVDSTGVSPKAYARVLRFVASMLEADRDVRPSWADIAARAGYCDQSHLIRECEALSGASPAALHAERRRETIALA